jgi:RecJ-like exonuclease
MKERNLSEEEVNQILGEDVCPECGGDGVETCTNPDHGFIEGVGGELSRLGCPVCGHDPDFKVQGSTCPACKGTGKVSKLEQDEIREAFFKSFPVVYSGVVFDKKLDMYVKKGSGDKDQRVDICNSRYNIFKAGYKSASSRIAELEEEVEQLKEEIESLTEEEDVWDDDSWVHDSDMECRG